MTDPFASTTSISQSPSEMLRQVARSMYGREVDTTIAVTVPASTTWQSVLHATQEALGEVDGPMTVMAPRTEAQRRRLRQIALDNVAEWNSSASAAMIPIGLPIHTRYDVSTLPMPKPSSDATRRRLKERMLPLTEFREPYLIRPVTSITEKTLPIVTVNIVLNGIDGAYKSGIEELREMEVLWDTGAQQTIITEDVLSAPFREFLQEPIHDPYRSKDALCVQIDAVIGFSNAPIKISAVALVVPKSVVPNGRVGVIFGQQQCIDCISYSSVPRRILKARGDDISDEVWGELIVDGFINEDEELVSL